MQPKNPTWYCSALVTLLIATGTAFAAVDPAVVARELRSKAVAEGRVSVIIGLDVPVVPEATLAASASERQRQAIRNAQTRLLEDLDAFDADPTRRFSRIPFLAMSVDAATLDYLAHHPAIRSLEVDDLYDPVVNTSGPLVASDVAQAWGHEGAGWAVAVLDNGVDTTHPWLSGQVIREACFSDDDPNSDLTSLCPNGQGTQTGTGAAAPAGSNVNAYDHGTHVAGTALQNNFSYTGMAPAASLIAVQVFSLESDEEDCDPRPAPCTKARRSDWVAAMEWVADLTGPPDDLQVASVNLSLGGGAYSSACDPIFPSVVAVVDDLEAAGVVVVSSAGNDGDDHAIGGPACVSDIVSVGAVDDSDEVADFSNSALIMDLFAPGVDIIAATVGGGVTSKDGTSMASPHVAGAVAQMRSAAPTATVADIKQALTTNGVFITLPGYPQSSKVRLRVDCAIADLAGVATPTGLIATDGVFDDRIELSWDDDFRVNRWDVYYSESSDPQTAQHLTFVDQPTAAIPGLTPGIRYTFWVEARTCSTVSDLSAAEEGWRAAPGILGLDASDGAFADKVRLTWGQPASPLPQELEVWRGLTADPGAASQIASLAGSATSYDDTSAAWQSYFYWVRGVWGAGADQTGPFGAADGGHLLLPAPGNVTASDGLYTDRVQVFWNTVVDGGTRYEVDRATATGAFAPLATNIAGNVYDDASAQLGETYRYRVRATRGTLVSADSLVDEGWRRVPVATALDVGFAGARDGQLQWGDWNGDGLFDLTVAGLDGLSEPETSAYANTSARGATPTFAPATLGLPNVDSLRWGDPDGDNDLDLVLAGYTGSSIVTDVWENDAGSFSAMNLGLPLFLSAASAWADVDGDGDQDLVMTGYQGGRQVTVFRNDAPGFTPLPDSFVGASGGDVDVADVDGDGDLDLAYTGTGEDDVPITRLYLNDGSGSFTDSGAPLTDLDASCLAFGDTDGDGDPDLAIAGADDTDTRRLLVYRNDSGSFQDIGAAGLTGLAICDLGWADVDNDGDLDLTASGIAAAGPSTIIYRADGGTFTDADAEVTAVDGAALDWADVDLDGDADLVLAGRPTGGAPTTTYYRNEALITNTPPGALTALTATSDGSGLTFSWAPATDDHTPVGGLTYNLRVGTAPGLTDVVSPMADASGRRLVGDEGNVGAATSWTLRQPAPGVTYHWSVQAIDGAWCGSPFATEATAVYADPSLIFADGFESGDDSAW